MINFLVQIRSASSLSRSGLQINARLCGGGTIPENSFLCTIVVSEGGQRSSAPQRVANHFVCDLKKSLALRNISSAHCVRLPDDIHTTPIDRLATRRTVKECEEDFPLMCFKCACAVPLRKNRDLCTSIQRHVVLHLSQETHAPRHLRPRSTACLPLDNWSIRKITRNPPQMCSSSGSPV